MASRIRVILCGVVMLAPLQRASGQVAQPGPLARAYQMNAGGDVLGALRLLDSLTTVDSSVAAVWSMKSAILLSLHRPTDALAALGQLDGLPAYAALVDYRRGIALGQLGRRDEAFAALERARESGRIDMTQIMSDTTADPLREDPRFRKLLPSEEEYAHPFVENVPLMQEWRGEATGDFFGWIARDVGDVDGDQVHDIVTSAPFARNAAGTVHLLRPGTPEPVWTVEGEPGSRLGTGLEAAGDVNGDGVPDVVAGAPGGDYVLLLSGADGLILRRIAGRQSGEGFGTRVSDFGDFDGDGAADVLVGAPANSRHGTGSGGVYVISGRTGESLLVLHGKSAGDRFGSSLAGRVLDGGWIIAVGTPGAGVGGEVQVFRGDAADPAFTIRGDSASVALGGMFSSIVGDVDADGVLDVLATDFQDRTLGPATGSALVYSGSTGRLLHSLRGEHAGDGFGIGAADAGDIDADGADDLVLGAWRYSSAAALGGKIYLLSGRDGRQLATLTGRVMGETLGFDATGLGDVDGDGVNDLLLTSAQSSANGQNSGRVLLVSGAQVLGAGAP